MATVCETARNSGAHKHEQIQRYEREESRADRRRVFEDRSRALAWTSHSAFISLGRALAAREQVRHPLLVALRRFHTCRIFRTEKVDRLLEPAMSVACLPSILQHPSARPFRTTTADPLPYHVDHDLDFPLVLVLYRVCHPSLVALPHFVELDDSTVCPVSLQPSGPPLPPPTTFFHPRPPRRSVSSASPT